MRDEPTDEEQRILRDLEDRVRKVRHLDAFEYSSREDGRFSLRLAKAPEELSEEERESVARLLTQLAETIRNC